MGPLLRRRRRRGDVGHDPGAGRGLARRRAADYAAFCAGARRPLGVGGRSHRQHARYPQNQGRHRRGDALGQRTPPFACCSLSASPCMSAPYGLRAWDAARVPTVERWWRIGCMHSTKPSARCCRRRANLAAPTGILPRPRVASARGGWCCPTPSPRPPATVTEVTDIAPVCRQDGLGPAPAPGRAAASETPCHSRRRALSCSACCCWW